MITDILYPFLFKLDADICPILIHARVHVELVHLYHSID